MNEALIEFFRHQLLVVQRGDRVEARGLYGWLPFLLS